MTPPPETLTPQALFSYAARIQTAVAEPAARPLARWAGGVRQPAHTVYGGAHLFGRGAASKLGDRARAALFDYAGSSALFGELFEISPTHAPLVFERVLRKLEHEPVEDLRIDFEDGYGVRSDTEEDLHADKVGGLLAELKNEELGPRLVGIRIKAMADAPLRALRTLDLCLTALVAKSDGTLPRGFVVTLPKVESAVHVAVLAEALLSIERTLGLPEGGIPVELMVESNAPLAVSAGGDPLHALLAAAEGRCRGVHFGVYDYLSALGVSAIDQRMRHPLADFARNALLVSLSGTEQWLSDGVTNVLPLPVHRGAQLSAEEKADNQKRIWDAWRLHKDDVRHGLSFGIFQGWDVHPAQIVSRYAAVYAYYLEALPLATSRLSGFLSALAQATRVGALFDDAATGRGLLAFFARGYASQAISLDECQKAGLVESDLDAPDLRRTIARVRGAARGGPQGGG